WRIDSHAEPSLAGSSHSQRTPLRRRSRAAAPPRHWRHLHHLAHRERPRGHRFAHGFRRPRTRIGTRSFGRSSLRCSRCAWRLLCFHSSLQTKNSFAKKGPCRGSARVGREYESSWRGSATPTLKSFADIMDFEERRDTNLSEKSLTPRAFRGQRNVTGL